MIKSNDIDTASAYCARDNNDIILLMFIVFRQTVLSRTILRFLFEH